MDHAQSQIENVDQISTPRAPEYLTRKDQTRRLFGGFSFLFIYAQPNICMYEIVYAPWTDIGGATTYLTSLQPVHITNSVRKIQGKGNRMVRK